MAPSSPRLCMADSFSVSAVSLNAGIIAYLPTLAVFIPVSGGGTQTPGGVFRIAFAVIAALAAAADAGLTP